MVEKVYLAVYLSDGLQNFFMKTAIAVCSAALYIEKFLQAMSETWF